MSFIVNQPDCSTVPCGHPDLLTRLIRQLSVHNHRRHLLVCQKTDTHSTVPRRDRWLSRLGVTCPQTVVRPGTNRARRRTTSSTMTMTNMLTTAPRRHCMRVRVLLLLLLLLLLLQVVVRVVSGVLSGTLRRSSHVWCEWISGQEQRSAVPRSQTGSFQQSVS